MYLDGDAILTGQPKTTFTATHQGVGYIFQHDPQCSWFEYDWVDGHQYGTFPDCAVLGTYVFAGDSSLGAPSPATCKEANSANLMTALYMDQVSFTCSEHA